MENVLVCVQNYHVPDNWLVEPIHSIYDLDNIKASLSSHNGCIWIIVDYGIVYV
jgi:hypothetical protein